MEWSVEDGRRGLARMRERASCRNFADKDIPGDLLDDIIDTGLCAASGGNLQPLSIIVIKDKDEREKLCEICGGQRFITQAPVNLLFILDWHKMEVFARNEKAPFTCDNSFMHFLIALEDVMCAAQMIDTGAELCGVTSCYVGTVNTSGARLIEMFNLPKRTYPVLLLSLGYAANNVPVTVKLERDIMVFDGKYPDLSGEFITEKYRNKYKDRSLALPQSDEHRRSMLETFRLALETTYSAEEAAEITAQAEALGRINETQRRFGLHYHAKHMREHGMDVMKMMADNGLTFFEKE